MASTYITIILILSTEYPDRCSTSEIEKKITFKHPEPFVIFNNIKNLKKIHVTTNT